jgi:hypothetical protein
VHLSGVSQASSPAGSGGVSPPVPTSRTETVLELAAEDGCATTPNWYPKAFGEGVFRSCQGPVRKKSKKTMKKAPQNPNKTTHFKKGADITDIADIADLQVYNVCYNRRVRKDEY